MALLGPNPTHAPQVQAALNMDGWTLRRRGPAHDAARALALRGCAAGRTAGRPFCGALLLTTSSNARTLRRSTQASLRAAAARLTYRARSTPTSPTRTLVSPIQRLTYTGPLSGDRVRPLVRSLVLTFFDQSLKQQGRLPADAQVQIICR